MSFRRIPREIDPRRPPKRREQGEGEEREPRSYGQYVDTSRDEFEDIEEFEEVTDEVAREGDAPATSDDRADATPAGREPDEREEFEDLAGEPTREEGTD